MFRVDLFILFVTIVEIHTLIPDVCVCSKEDFLTQQRLDYSENTKNIMLYKNSATIIKAILT